ncbi:MAG: hypothetical protein AAFV90_20520 [Cyanobacteria bacterium J06634_5]
MLLARHLSRDRTLPIKLYSQDFYLIFNTCTSSLFCIMGMIVLPSNLRVGLQTLLFFGACLAVFVHQLRTQTPFLRLDYAGFTVGFSKSEQYQVPWPQVEGFKVVRQQGMKRVGWRYQPAYRREVQVTYKHDIDEMLPAAYGVNPRELAKLMNELNRCYRMTAEYLNPP